MMGDRGEYVHVHTTGGTLVVVDVNKSLDKGLLELDEESRCASTTLGAVRSAVRHGNALVERSGMRVLIIPAHVVALTYYPPRSER